MKKLSILALALSVLAASCTKEADEMGSGRAKAGEIRVSAMVNGITKATTDGAVTTFENGDQLSLYVWTGDNKAVPGERWIDGEVNTFNAETGKWEPKDMMLWKNTAEAHYFLGVYPARTITNFTADLFSVNLDPAAKNDVNDLLVATILGEGVKASVNPVPLTMDHLMAKLNISIRFRDQWGGIPDNVTVSVKTAVTGTVDYISKTITRGNDVVEQPVFLVGADLEDPVAHYASLVIPQTGVTEITVTVNGTKYVYTHPTSIPLTKGHVTTLPLVVGKDVIALDGDVTVEGWTAGELPDLNENASIVPPTDLATIKADYIASDGETLTGTLDANVKISIADGATVILDNASISYSSNGADWAGLTLIGDGTIQLADGTTNTAIGGLDSDGYSNCPGIFVPEGKTLTINGDTGVLIAACGDGDPDGQGAGIGASWFTNSGNIVINGGVISATGGNRGAGIGGSGRRNCGYITINGGTVTATGHEGAPGIGIGGAKQSNYEDGGTCGDITITGGTVIATGGKWGAGIGTGNAFNSKNVTVTKTCGNILISGGTVTATGGEHAAGIGTGEAEDGKGIINIGTITITDGVTLLTATKGEGAPNSIGKGSGTNVTCGTVTIAGTVYPDGVAKSPYVYPEPPKDLADATAEDVGKAIGADGKIYSNADAATKASTTAVAIIAYVGSAGSVDASSATYKGLAIAMSDANNGNVCTWGPKKNCLKDVGHTSTRSTAIGYKNGITCTGMLTSDSDEHAAATAAASNNGTGAPTSTSGWFLPSVGQWNLIVQGLATKKAGSAITTDLTGDPNDDYKASNLNSVITNAGGTGFQEKRYWTSTEWFDVNSSASAWGIVTGDGRTMSLDKTTSDNKYVRSVIAF